MPKVSDVISEFNSKTTFKSFSVNALKNGGWKIALKFAANDDDTKILMPLAITYRPIKNRHVIIVSLLGQELKAQATVEDDHIIADLAIPEYLRLLLAASGISADIAPSVHLSITANPTRDEDGGITVDISTEINDKQLDLRLFIVSKREDTEDDDCAEFTKRNTLLIAGKYGDKTVSAKSTQTITYQIGAGTVDILCDLFSTDE